MDETVAVGQWWADNDWRQEGRVIEVVAIEGDYAVVKVVANPKSPKSVALAEKGHRTKIRLNRFRPTSTGFKLAWKPETAVN